MRTRVTIFSGILALALAIFAYVWGLPAYRSAQDVKLRQTLATDPRTADSYQLLLKGEERISREQDNPEGYLTVGLAWKSIGDLTGNREYLVRAKDTYERGVLLFGDRNVIVTLNAANLNRELGEYVRAEELYREAIRVNPGGTDGYLGLVELYRYNLQKEPNEIIDVYRQALAAVLDNAELVQNLAFYLKDVGRYADALSYFELLEKKYPGQFASVVDEINQKIASGG